MITFPFTSLFLLSDSGLRSLTSTGYLIIWNILYLLAVSILIIWFYKLAVDASLWLCHVALFLNSVSWVISGHKCRSPWTLTGGTDLAGSNLFTPPPGEAEGSAEAGSEWTFRGEPRPDLLLWAYVIEVLLSLCVSSLSFEISNDVCANHSPPGPASASWAGLPSGHVNN